MGAQVSNAHTTVDNVIKGSITNTMESNVKGDVTAACSNLQVVDGARNCNINFAEQICEAVAISNMTSNTSLDAQISQDVMNQVRSQVEASAEGQLILMAQVSNSSNVIKNEVDLSMATTQTFTTSCTRNISAINEQAVRNTDCQGAVINFAPQMISAEVIGDCVANHVGTLQAAQSMTNVLDLATSATTKGIDIWAFVIMIVGFFLIFVLGIPIFLYGIRYAVASPLSSKQQDPRAKGKMYMAVFVFAMMILTAIIWWPGFFSIMLGIAPWPYIGVQSVGGLAPLCTEDKNVDPEVFVNTWMWNDPHCLAIPGNTYCGPDDQTRHYESCGLFASQFGCDDTQFKDDSAEYKKMLQVCGKLTGHPFQKCTTQDIALNVFAQDAGSYGSCVKCTDTQGTALSNYGLWRKSDGSCSSGISKTAYMRTNGACPSDDLANCKENEEALNSVSPNECKDEGYQARKKRFSRYWQGCMEVEQNSNVTEETLGYIPNVSQQCPPDPFDYLTKCERGSKTCKYVAKGCTNCDADGNCDCSQADARTVASCHNNLQGCCIINENGDRECSDKDYESDLLAYEAANETCRKRWESRHYFNPWGWIIPLICYILGIIYIGYVLTYDSNAMNFRNGLYHAWNRPGIKKAKRYGLIFFVFCCIMASGWPFGVLALINAGKTGSIYSKDIHKKMDSFDPEDPTYMYIGYGVFGVSCLAFVYLVLKAWFNPIKQELTTAPPLTTAVKM